MSEGDAISKKDPKPDKKVLLTTLSQAVNPLMKELEQDQQSLVSDVLFSKCQN